VIASTISHTAATSARRPGHRQVHGRDPEPVRERQGAEAGVLGQAPRPRS